MSGPKSAAHRPIGEFAYETYREAAGLRDRPPWSELLSQDQRIWAAVEQAIGQETVMMMGDVLDAFGVEMPSGMACALAKIPKAGPPR